MAAWARDLKITRQALRFRLASKEWSYEDALTIVGRNQVRGEKHKLAKLKDADVVRIRQRRKKGERLASLAARFGVSEARISKLCTVRKRKQ